METLTENIKVEELLTDALDVEPVDYDWSEGYPEVWDYVEAPCCPECDSYCTWSRVNYQWECPKKKCDNFGHEVDPHENGAEGPMMNYYYPIPRFPHGWYEAAELIADLPLCVVYFEEEGDYALALTGGGMDLSWQICEAFMRLGYLPPVHYSDLPGMAGTGDRPDEKKVVEACIRSLYEWAAISERRSTGYIYTADKLRKRYLEGEE